MSAIARWAEGFEARARAYWTPERTRALLDGKDLPIQPAGAPRLLRALGLLNADASMPPCRVKKYRQINHMVKLLRPMMDDMFQQHAVVRLIDAGCGRSYLSLLLAWCARHLWAHEVEVLGVDRNAAVLEECRRRSRLAALDGQVRFEAGRIDGLDAHAAWKRAFGGGPGVVNGVIALHACDTATCDALALGVGLGVQMLAVAPCCQAELARGWSSLGEASGDLSSIWRMPHLRRETAAHVTDAMRTLLLRAVGYRAEAIEFVPVEHTRKNTLIRALRASAPDVEARREYEGLVRATGGVELALAGRILR